MSTVSAVSQDFEVYYLCRNNDVTLRKDCRCACHAATNAVIHVHPCCGPGSVGWPPENVLPSEMEPYETLTLFGNDKGNKPADGASADESGDEKSSVKSAEFRPRK